MHEKESRSEKVTIRVEPSLNKEAQKIADDLGVNGAGALMHKLLKEFVKATDQHGENLIWPPKFEHYTYTETSQTKKNDLEEAG
jgi:hypothetical protein